MSQNEQEPFLFSSYLKTIEPDISKEQYDELRAWNTDNQTYQGDKQSFVLNPDDDTALACKSSIDALKDKEVSLNSTLSTIYLNMPDPEQYKNNWDWGKKEAECQERVDALESMKTYTQKVYVQAKKDDKEVEDYLNGHPTPDPSPGGDAVETTLIIMNNTPYTLTLKALVTNEAQWANSTNRPDKNISGPLILKAFTSTTLKEDIANDANAAIYNVDGTVADKDTVSGDLEAESFLFTANQYLAIDPPVITEEESLEQGLPLNSMILDTTNSGFWVLQQFFDKSKKTLSLSISEKHGEA